LGKLKPGEPVNIFYRRSSHFKLPKLLDSHVIMVGPGTGVAPFRSFWRERDAQKSSGEMMLFFGCRWEKKDWLYKEEMLNRVKARGFTLFYCIRPRQKHGIFFIFHV